MCAFSCMYACEYVSLRVYVCICACVCEYACMYCACVCTYLYVYWCLCVCVHVYLCVFLCLFLSLCLCKYLGGCLCVYIWFWWCVCVCVPLILCACMCTCVCKVQRTILGAIPQVPLLFYKLIWEKKKSFIRLGWVVNEFQGSYCPVFSGTSIRSMCIKSEIILFNFEVRAHYNAQSIQDMAPPLLPE